MKFSCFFLKKNYTENIVFLYSNVRNMKIKQIIINNFRNLKNIDTEFWDINILTWKNSTGKTNLIKILANSCNTIDKAKDIFWENIVTIWRGLSQTKISTTISWIKHTTQLRYPWKNILKIYQPEEFTFEHTISKSTLSSEKWVLKYSWKTKEVEIWEVNKAFFNEHGFIKLSAIVNWEIKLEALQQKEVFKKQFLGELEDNSIIEEKNRDYLDIFERVVNNKIIHFENNQETCTKNIYDFITKKYTSEKYKSIVNKIKWEEEYRFFQSFEKASFIDLLSDIQKNKDIYKKYSRDLDFFSDGIIKNIKINTIGKEWGKGEIFVKTPHWPKDVEYLSTGSAVLVYFITLKNWIELNRIEKPYDEPDIMLFDEIDSSIHPSLIWRFCDLLKIISKRIQLFITTHSLCFIDNFEKKEIFLLKDHWSFAMNTKVLSNIYSYEDIITKLDKKEKKVFDNMLPSELYINSYVDTLFPINQK